MSSNRRNVKACKSIGLKKSTLLTFIFLIPKILQALA